MPSRTAFLPAIGAYFDSFPALWPLFGFVFSPVRKLRGNIRSVPKLHPEAYEGVYRVIDRTLPSGIIIRNLAMRACRDKPARILVHVHDNIREEFEVLRCDCPDECFVLLENEHEAGTLKRVPLQKGMTFSADPGVVHGLEVGAGTLVLKVRVKDFDSHDVKIVADKYPAIMPVIPMRTPTAGMY